MDPELSQSISAYVEGSSFLTELTPEQADQLRLAVAAKFGFPENRLWWWESLPGEAISIPYEDDWLAQLQQLLPDTGAPLYLFVSDEEFPPWPCVSGPSAELIDMIREQRLFEYFIVNAELTLIVFDTHHDVLHALGEHGRGERL